MGWKDLFNRQSDNQNETTEQSDSERKTFKDKRNEFAETLRPDSREQEKKSSPEDKKTDAQDDGDDNENAEMNRGEAGHHERKENRRDNEFLDSKRVDQSKMNQDLNREQKESMDEHNREDKEKAEKAENMEKTESSDDERVR